MIHGVWVQRAQLFVHVGVGPAGFHVGRPPKPLAASHEQLPSVATTPVPVQLAIPEAQQAAWSTDVGVPTSHPLEPPVHALLALPALSA